MQRGDMRPSWKVQPRVAHTLVLTAISREGRVVVSVMAPTGSDRCHVIRGGELLRPGMPWLAAGEAASMIVA